MRTAVSDLEDFYERPIGQLVADVLIDKLFQAWGAADGLRVVGFGYPAPFMNVFSDASHRLILAPEGVGVRAGGDVHACMVQDYDWPLPDSSVDRLLIIHGLEEGAGPRRLMREAWRVLADDGLMIIAVANRRGPWAVVETSPFAAGRPFSRRQLTSLLQGSMFAPTATATALHFPPINSKGLLRIARTWERLGATIESWNLPWLLPNLAGLNLVEARKSTAIPLKGSKAEVFRPGILVPNGLRPASNYDGRDKTNRAASADRFDQPGS